MSGSKTGVGFVDNTVSAVSNGINNVGSQIGNGINNVGAQIGNGLNNVGSQLGNGLNNVGSQASDTVRDLVAGYASNFEKGIADAANGVGLALRGDFTGFDRTLIDAFPAAWFFSETDKDNWTGTTKAETQLQQKANKEAAAAEQAAKDYEAESALADIRSVISGQVGARMRAPGRDMTLINSSGYKPSTYTLLTQGAR